MEFHETLINLRKTLGHNQEEMGRRLGLSLNYINALENQKKAPSDAVKNHVALLKRAVDCGLFEAAGGVRLPAGSSEDLEEWKKQLPKDAVLADEPAPYSPYQAAQKALRH